MSCGEKIKQEEWQRAQEERESGFAKRVEEVKQFYTNANDMKKYADESKDKLITDYPEKRSLIEKNFVNQNISNDENYITVNFDKDCDVEDLYRKIEKQLRHPLSYWNLV